jgi:hypothetical protein
MSVSMDLGEKHAGPLQAFHKEALILGHSLRTCEYARSITSFQRS